MKYPLQDKILQSTGRGHEVNVTNDGATILKSLHVDNPAAKVLVGILKFGFYGAFKCFENFCLSSLCFFGIKTLLKQITCYIYIYYSHP